MLLQLSVRLMSCKILDLATNIVWILHNTLLMFLIYNTKMKVITAKSMTSQTDNQNLAANGNFHKGKT